MRILGRYDTNYMALVKLLPYNNLSDVQCKKSVISNGMAITVLSTEV